MKTRVPVRAYEIDVAMESLKQELSIRLMKHGADSFIGPHEMLGMITEEYTELTEAVHANNPDAVRSELLDIACGAIFAVASSLAIDRWKRGDIREV